MNLINWINGVTKLNKTTMDTFQDNISDEFSEIGEPTIIYNDSVGSNTNITFENAIESANDIEIIYCRRRVSNGTSVYKSTGKIPYSNGTEIALDINYYSNDTGQQSIAKLVTVNSTGITVTGENTMVGSNISTSTTIYIIKVIIYN